MITNTGQTIIGKYLLGYAPAYASHIAIGCGSKPYKSTDSVANYAEKKSLDFEMFRVPISSKGFVTEVVNGQSVSKIVLTAELPSEERYEISELGLYSAEFNETAGDADSKVILSFSDNESWKFYNGTTLGEPTLIGSHLGGVSATDIIQTTDKAIVTYSDNAIFYKTTRTARYERGRFFNSCIMLRGDSADLSLQDGRLGIETGSLYLQKTISNINLKNNTLDDELRLAIALVNKDGTSNIQPDSVRILLEFSIDGDSSKSARVESVLQNGTDAGEIDFSTNRYHVINTNLDSIYTTTDFNWNSANTVKVYVSVLDSNGDATPNFYVLLDGLRLENLSAENALYGLTGYSVIQNTSGTTVVKESNTNNYVEFRFAIGVA